MKKSSVHRMQRFMYFQILCFVLERWIRTQHQILFGKCWFKDSPQYRTLDTIDGEPMEFEWNISQDSPHCCLSAKSKSSWTEWSTQHNSKDEFSSCRCSMTSHGELQTMNGNALLTPHLRLHLQKDFQQDVGHFSDLDQKRSGILLTMTNHEEKGTESLNWWWSNLEQADTQFSEPRVHFLEERSKAKEVENYRYTSVPMVIRSKLFFAQLFLFISSVSTKQSQICVKNTVLVKQERWDPCWQDNLNHFSSQQDCRWQHLHFWLRFQHKILLNKYKERVERLSQKDRVIKDLCTCCRIPGNSWCRTVFHDEAHWRVLTIYRTSDMSWEHFCHEMKNHLTRRGNTKIGPVLEVTTSYLQGKCGVEIRIESVNKDNSHSCVRISHGLNKLVTDLIDKEYDDNEQETSETKTDEFALKKNECTCFCKLINGRSKTKKTYLCLCMFKNCTYSWKDVDWHWTKSSIRSSVPSGKKTKHSSSAWTLTWRRRRWCDWILEIKKSIFREKLWILSIDLMQCGRTKSQEAEATRKNFNIELTRQEVDSLSPSSSRSFRTQSHWSYISGQCEFWTISSSTFYLSYWMCNQFTLHHKFKNDTGRTKFKQGKTDSIPYGCESHRQGTQKSGWAWLDQTTSCIVQAAKVEKTPRHGVLGRKSACSTERIEGLSKRTNAIILYDTLPAYCISKVLVMESGEIIYEKVFVSPRPPPTISF